MNIEENKGLKVFEGRERGKGAFGSLDKRKLLLKTSERVTSKIEAEKDEPCMRAMPTRCV